MPFTGSDLLSSAIAMDKSKTKQIWKSYHLPTAKYQIIIKDDFDPALAEDILASLSGTVMVKPVNEGSSIGMAKAENAEQLVNALTEAFKFDNKVLLETWITGQEFTVSMLNGEALPAIRMQTENAFYDYQAKYQSSDTLYFCPCGLAPDKLAELNQLAIKAFTAIGCSGWGRVDCMLDEQGAWYLLEVNTVPGMTETSLVPKAAKQAGYDFDQLVLEILKQTL
jgi:D-alanine-D-alanine ligase